jgi:hypothetical protein
MDISRKHLPVKREHSQKDQLNDKTQGILLQALCDKIPAL